MFPLEPPKISKEFAMHFWTKEKTEFDVSARFTLIVGDKVVWAEPTLPQILAMVLFYVSMGKLDDYDVYDCKFDKFIPNNFWERN